MTTEVTPPKGLTFRNIGRALKTVGEFVYCPTGPYLDHSIEKAKAAGIQFDDYSSDRQPTLREEIGSHGLCGIVTGGAASFAQLVGVPNTTLSGIGIAGLMGFTFGPPIILNAFNACWALKLDLTRFVHKAADVTRPARTRMRTTLETFNTTKVQPFLDKPLLKRPEKKVSLRNDRYER